MKCRLVIILIFGFFLNSSAQENKVDTIRLSVPPMNIPPLKTKPLFPDLNYFKLSDVFAISKPNEFQFNDSAIMIRNWDHLSYTRRPSTKKPILPFDITPNLNFNINPSRWELPVLGATTTFSPTLTYAPVDRLFLYGGVGFTQYHNLHYVQNIMFPDWPVKSNITTQGFLGGAFVLHDRITLRATYQKSLHNEMPGNMIFFAPAFQMATFGADIDVWNGLGVSVDKVWEFDKSGKMRSGMRYSPYINMNKFMKFLRGY